MVNYEISGMINSKNRHHRIFRGGCCLWNYISPNVRLPLLHCGPHIQVPWCMLQYTRRDLLNTHLSQIETHTHRNNWKCLDIVYVKTWNTEWRRKKKRWTSLGRLFPFPGPLELLFIARRRTIICFHRNWLPRNIHPVHIAISFAYSSGSDILRSRLQCQESE